MPRTPKQFEEIREEKRNLIMDTALEHFAKEGYHQTTINHIARHAGISKGLMYNYFSSKEELLSELIKRSVIEVYQHFDPDKDGFLTEDEFELFVRKVTTLLREKKSIWMLFFQMMMQNEVIELFMGKYSGGIKPGDKKIPEELRYISGIFEMMYDYFARKKKRMPAGYDPAVEMNMFIITLKGFAITWIYSLDDNDTLFMKTADRIIETYK